MFLSFFDDLLLILVLCLCYITSSFIFVCNNAAPRIVEMWMSISVILMFVMTLDTVH